MIAVGVASPSASGQVMTTTVMAKSSASLTEPAGREPGQEGAGAGDEGDEHQPERGPVREPLSGRLGVLRLLHERHDLGQRGVGADLGGPDPQRAGGVDGGADDRVARRLVHGQALAGDHRLVDLGLAFLDDPVGGDLGAGPDQEQVSDDDLRRGDLDRFAVADDEGLGWRQVEERADGVVGAAAGAHLEPVPEQHERGQHRGRLVEHLTATGEGDPERVRPARADGDRDEHHHVERPRAQGPPGPVEEDPGGVEHHRQRQQQAEHVVAEAERRGCVETEHLPADRGPQQDGHRQQRGDEEPVAHVADHVGHRHGAVTTVAHRVVRRAHRGRGREVVTRVRLVVDVLSVPSDGPGLGHRVADVVGHRLAGAVVPAVAYPVAQVGHARAVGVVGDGRGLRHRARVHGEHTGSPGQDGFDDVLARGPLNPGHLQHRRRGAAEGRRLRAVLSAAVLVVGHDVTFWTVYRGVRGRCGLAVVAADAAFSDRLSVTHCEGDEVSSRFHEVSGIRELSARIVSEKGTSDPGVSVTWVTY